jgi:hypothetical protein
MVLPQGPSARLLWLVTRAGVDRIVWLVDVFRSVRGGDVKTFRWIDIRVGPALAAWRPQVGRCFVATELLVECRPAVAWRSARP